MAETTCYNKGCGKKFYPSNNNVEDCIYHPGVPIFHDAYKGWSCCNKKSTDFTEFLNFKGCTTGKHSDEKPVEPEKPKKSEKELEEMIEKAKPSNVKPIQIDMNPRPNFDLPLVTLQPEVNPSFKQEMDNLDLSKSLKSASLNDSGVILIGTTCKHGGCNCTYESPKADQTDCVYHPGVPVFHEGYKFWSCCKKRTTDFTTFMGQPGCQTGKHKWIQADESAEVVKCRWDWHQTASNVVIAVYAKQYDYKKSWVKINPIRLVIKLVFPKQHNAEFNIDLELRGVVDVPKSSVKMFGTKIEITLPKAEAGSWSKLDFPRTESQVESTNDLQQKITESKLAVIEKDLHKSDPDSDFSDVDLDDIEPTKGATISELNDYKLMEEA